MAGHPAGHGEDDKLERGRDHGRGVYRSAVLKPAGGPSTTVHPYTPRSLFSGVSAHNEMGLSRKELEPFIGSRARVSEVLNGKRGLTLSMIRRLHEGLNIPLENLVKRVA